MSALSRSQLPVVNVTIEAEYSFPTESLQSNLIARGNEEECSHDGACTTGDLGPQVSALLRDGANNG